MLSNNLIILGDPKNEAQTNEEIKEADVLMLLYDISSKDYVDHLKLKWMPRINKINSQVYLTR